MNDPAKKVEWYEVRAHDGHPFLIMVSEIAGGDWTAVPVEVSMVRSSLTASGSSPADAAQKLEALISQRTRREVFGGTS